MSPNGPGVNSGRGDRKLFSSRRSWSQSFHRLQYGKWDKKSHKEKEMGFLAGFTGRCFLLRGGRGREVFVVVLSTKEKKREKRSVPHWSKNSEQPAASGRMQQGEHWQWQATGESTGNWEISWKARKPLMPHKARSMLQLGAPGKGHQQGVRAKEITTHFG